MPARALTPRAFDADDQHAFAVLSGDANPLHLDPLAARRSVAGARVVHGVHALLWALDAWVATAETAFAISRLDVIFLKPIPVGAAVTSTVVSEGERRVSMELRVEGQVMASVDLAYGPPSVQPMVTVPDARPAVRPPAVQTIDKLEDCRGTLPLLLPMTEVTAALPSLVTRLPGHQLAALLASTQMVGMACPGLHSLYSELHLTQEPVTDETPIWSYQVTRADRRFGLVSIAVSSPGLAGHVQAFVRPEPQLQPSSAVIRRDVAPDEFRHQQALIVGGSRGLGEVLAKVLAAGGANVVLTYFQGAADAETVAADIRASGGTAAVRRMNVTDDASIAAAAADVWRPTHLYYLAAPPIGAGARGPVRDTVLAAFRRQFVEGFERVVRVFATPSLQAVFYPSTVFIDQQPGDLLEYVQAKREGEAIAEALAVVWPTVQFAVRRLPRLETDQTLSLGPTRRAPVLPAMLSVARELAHGKVGTQ